MATGQQRDSQKEQNAPISKPFPFPELLREIQKEWNKAESAIKRSEQVAKEVSIPAISELRYGGRRLIDALDASQHGGNEDKIKALLEDARFCCHRAQHDAIDAAMAKIGIDLDNLTSKLGFEPIIHAYPDFREFYAEFANARSKIATSRENRDDRNGIYESITAVDLPAIVDRYEKVLAVRPIAKSAAFRMRMGGVNAVILTVAAVAACVFGALAVDWSKYFGPNNVGQVQADGTKKANTGR